jgi:hypothetical protein
MLLVKAFHNWVRRTSRHITVPRVQAAGILFAAGSFGVACLQYGHQWREERLQRALSLIEKSNTQPVAPQYRALAKTDDEEEAAKWKAVEAWRAVVVHLPDLFQGKPIPSKPLDKSLAKRLVDTALKPEFDADDRKLYEQWDAARRHLNDL